MKREDKDKRGFCNKFEAKKNSRFFPFIIRFYWKKLKAEPHGQDLLVCARSIALRAHLALRLQLFLRCGPVTGQFLRLQGSFLVVLLSVENTLSS